MFTLSNGYNLEPFLETVYDLPPDTGAGSPDLQARNTLILVPDEQSIPLATALFSKMFDKLGLESDKEAAILAVQNHPGRFAGLRRSFGFQRLVLCGVHPHQIGLQAECPIHMPLHLGTVFLLRTETPSGLESASREFKTAFWMAFQPAFTERQAP